MILADAQLRTLAASLPPTPAAVPAPTAPDAVPPADTRVQRRLRRIVRRRVRIDVAALGAPAIAASEGELTVQVVTVSAHDPRILAWQADRPVALVVLHDGCGARVLGIGGLAGRLELPAGICPRAFLAFCYDTDADGAGAERRAGAAITLP